MADYQKRVELLEDDAFNFLTDDLNISNNQRNNDIYNRTYNYTVRQSQGENRHIPDVNGNGPLCTTQNIGSYVKTGSDKEEELERLNLKIKKETQIADLNVRLPLYTTLDPDCPTSRSDIKEEEYQIPESNRNNGPLFASRVPDYMLESRSDLKEEIEEYQPESYGPLYASHVDYPRSRTDIKEEYDITDVDANYRPFYATTEMLKPKADVTYRPQLDFSSQRLSHSDLDTTRPSGPSNTAFTPQNAANSVFQESQNLAGVSGSFYIPKTSSNSMGPACATKRPNLTHGDPPLQSNILNTAPANMFNRVPNTAPVNYVRTSEPGFKHTHFSPQLDPNMFNRVPNQAPVNNGRTTEPGFNHTHFSPQFEPNDMLNRAPNTFVPDTEPRPNLSHSLLQSNSNMVNRPNFTHIPPQLEPNTLKRASHIVPANNFCATKLKPNFTHISTQIEPNTHSRQPNVSAIESMPDRTYSSPILDSNMFNGEPDNPNTAARFSELWYHLTHVRSKLESNMSTTKINTVPNTAVRVSESRPNHDPMLSKLLNMPNREPTTALHTAARFSKSMCHLSHDPPQLKSNMSNTEINTGPNTNVLASSKANLTPISPQLELNMSTREPNTALNASVCVSAPSRQKSNTEINTVPNTAVRVPESRPNLTTISPQFLNMSNREPNAAPNTSSRPNSSHGSQLHQMKNPYLQSTPQLAKASGKDVETKEAVTDGVQFRRRIPNGNSQRKCRKRNKVNFFHWEKQLRETISTSNEHSTKRHNMTSSTVRMNRNPVKRTKRKINKRRYMCTICTCIYLRKPRLHLKKQHGVKPANLWEHLHVYVKCRFCFKLIRTQLYGTHIKSDKCARAV